MSDEFEKMLKNPDFYGLIKELVEFGVSRYEENYSCRYQDTNLVLIRSIRMKMYAGFWNGKIMRFH